MTEQGAGGGPRGYDGGMPAVPDEVWARFAHDTERAIARSAPREPSARERAGGGGIDAPGWNPGEAVGSAWIPAEPTASAWNPAEAVGELWQPEVRPARPAWRDLDARARRRRIARLLGAAGAVVLLWAVASGAPVGPRDGYAPGDATVKQSEDAPSRVPAPPGAVPAVSPTRIVPARHAG